MSRPARLRDNLLDKISRKESRTPGAKPGKKAKAWRKWAEHYKAASEGNHAPVAAPAPAAPAPAAPAAAAAS